MGEIPFSSSFILVPLRHHPTKFCIDPYFLRVRHGVQHHSCSHKNVQDDLTPDQKKQVRKLVEAIKKE